MVERDRCTPLSKIIRCQKTDTCVCLLTLPQSYGLLVSYAKNGYLDRCLSRLKELDKN